MRFTATRWIERNYKMVSALMVVFATVSCCIAFLLSNKDSVASFFISMLYALGLYIVGVFTSTMSERVASSLHKKAQVYINLKRINELLDSFEHHVTLTGTDTIKDEIETLYSNIIFFNSFTGHTNDTSIDDNPYIKNLGVIFDEDFLRTQKQFFEMSKSIVTDVNGKLQDYIKANDVKTKVPYPHFDLKHISNPNLWCTEYVDGDYKDILELIYDIYEQYGQNFEELRNLMIAINNSLEEYKIECKKSISQLERMYGQKLKDFLEGEKLHFEDVEYIKRIIEDAENNLALRIDEIYNRINLL